MQIKKSEILALQEQGKTKVQIAEYYGVNDREMSIHYKTLNIKTKAKIPLKYSAIDDTLTPEQVKHQVDQLEEHKVLTPIV